MRHTLHNQGLTAQSRSRFPRARMAPLVALARFADDAGYRIRAIRSVNIASHRHATARLPRKRGRGAGEGELMRTFFVDEARKGCTLLLQTFARFSFFSFDCFLFRLRLHSQNSQGVFLGETDVSCKSTPFATGEETDATSSCTLARPSTGYDTVDTVTGLTPRTHRRSRCHRTSPRSTWCTETTE